jgi:hypothetical protein
MDDRREAWRVVQHGRSMSLEQRVRALTEVIADLLVEIEALRNLQLQDPLTRERYRLAYDEAAMLSHSSVGPSAGREKLVELFCATKLQPDQAPRPREALMLKRLGCTDEDIADFEQRAATAETCT